MQYVIKAVSGISGTCNLGDGKTEAEAWADAYGPKPWSPEVKRAARKAWCEKVDSDEPIDYSGHN